MTFPKILAGGICLAVVEDCDLDVPDILAGIFCPKKNVIASDRARKTFGGEIIGLVGRTCPVDGDAGCPCGIADGNQGWLKIVA